jgi:hypothetical protein
MEIVERETVDMPTDDTFTYSIHAKLETNSDHKIKFLLRACIHKVCTQKLTQYITST